MKWAEGQEITVNREPSDRANGLTRDVQGRLIACRARHPARDPAGARRQHHGGGHSYRGCG